MHEALYLHQRVYLEVNEFSSSIPIYNCARVPHTLGYAMKHKCVDCNNFYLYFIS